MILNEIKPVNRYKISLYLNKENRFLFINHSDELREACENNENLKIIIDKNVKFYPAAKKINEKIMPTGFGFSPY